MKTSRNFIATISYCLFLSVSSFSQTDSVKAYNDHIDQMLTVIKEQEQWKKDNGLAPEDKQYDYTRYQNSPCFSKLGYSAYGSGSFQEEMYCACEKEYYRNLMIKIASGTLMLGGIGYMLYLSRKKQGKWGENLFPNPLLRSSEESPHEFNPASHANHKQIWRLFSTAQAQSAFGTFC